MISSPPLRRLVAFFNDPEYYRRLLKIALPIALQQFIMSFLNMVNVLMVGQLGETPVAAVGLANQIFFLLMLVTFGTSSGSSIFTAQLWGRQDIPSIRKVLGLCLSVEISVSVIFFVIAEFFSETALGLYSNDPAVVALGSQYLRTFGWAFVFFAITQSYAFALRSIGLIKIPLVVTLGALSFNALLSYGLIFGHFGLPALGVQGAAIAGVAARILECSALVWITYRLRTPLAGRLKELLGFDLAFAKKVLKPVLTVALNELFWSLGITSYNAVYAHIGTDAIAAVNIASTVDGLAFTLFSGIGNGTAILVGHWIGSQQEEEAQRYAGRSLALGAIGGLLVGGIVFLISGPVLGLYKVSPIVIQYARNLLIVMSCSYWLRMMNMILLIGVLRSGGDTRYAFFLDGLIIWIVGVPSALLGAFVLHLPVYWVFLMVLSEELSKWILGMRRFISRKWAHNLAETVA